MWHVVGRVVGTVLLASAVATVAAQGEQGRPGRPPGGPGGFGAPGLPPVFMQLNLTADQRNEVRSIVQQDREARQAAMDALRTARKALVSAVYSTTPDTQQIGDLTAQLADLERQALEADIALQLKVSALLTDEQRQQVLTARGPGQE